MSNHFRPMPVSFIANGKPEVDSIEGLSPAIAIEQSLPVITHVQRLVRLPKFMTIYVCFMHVSARLIALNTTYLWLRKLFLKWSMR